MKAIDRKPEIGEILIYEVREKAVSFGPCKVIVISPEDLDDHPKSELAPNLIAFRHLDGDLAGKSSLIIWRLQDGDKPKYNRNLFFFE